MHQSAAPFVWDPWIRRVAPDGGIEALFAASSELQPTGDYGNATLFLPGELTPGERLRPESSGDCDGEAPSVDVLVGDAAPLPTSIGQPFSPAARHSAGRPPSLGCEPDEALVERDLLLEIDESVRPWLSIARVNLEVNGRPQSTAYGRLARGHDGGAIVFVERLTRLCIEPVTGTPSNTLQTWPVRLELEIPGVAERPPAVEFSAEMDCRPASCSSAGAAPWMFGVLLVLWRRTNRSLPGAGL